MELKSFIVFYSFLGGVRARFQHSLLDKQNILAVVTQIFLIANIWNLPTELSHANRTTFFILVYHSIVNGDFVRKVMFSIGF